MAYAGQIIRIPLGREGFVYSRNPSNLPPSGLLQASSIFYSDDSCRKMPGRSKLGGYAGVGAAFSFATTAINVGADTITKTAHGFVTADGPIVFSTTGGVPGGLGSGTDYWIIKVDADTIKLATSRANAIAGTQVDITSQGTGAGTPHSLTPRSVIGLYDWFPAEGVQYVVTVASNGKLYITQSATDPQYGQNETSLGSAATKRPILVECGDNASISTTNPGKMLAIFTGQSVPYAYRGSGTTPTPFSSPPTDWATSYPVNGVVHGARLHAIGVPSKPHALYSSTIDNHQDFKTGTETGNASASSAAYTHIHPGYGQRLYCCHSHKGLLVLLKYPRGVFYLDDTDISPTGWKSQMVTDSMGCAPTPFASIEIDDGILFMAASGQFFLLTAQTNGGITVTDLSTRMYLDQWLQSNVNLTRLDQVVGAWDSTLKIAYFAVPSKQTGSSSNTNDLLLYFDFRAFTRGDAKIRFGYTYRDQTQAITSRRNSSSYIYEVMAADYLGNVWKLGEDDRSINSALPGQARVTTGYQSIFQITHTDLAEYLPTYDPALAVMNKNFDWLGIEYVPGTGGTVSVIEYVDGAPQPTVTTTLTQSGPVLGSSPGNTEWTLADTDPPGAFGSIASSSLAGTSASGLALAVKWVRLVGTGRRWSVEIQSDSTAEHDVHVTALYLGFRRAGQDVGREGSPNT